MYKKLILISVWVALIGLILSACSGGGAVQPSGQNSQGDPASLPADFSGKKNPLAGKTDAAEAGKKLYTNDCSACHGDQGLGDGPAGASLEPKAANLVQSVKSRGEDYLFWRISEGGSMKPFNSSMPAWKGVESEDAIWKIITYMQTWK